MSSLIYKRLCDICAENDITPTALCVEITGSQGNLATWKKGNIRTDYLIGIANKLDCSTDYLLGITNIDNTKEGTNIMDKIYKLPDGLSGSQRALLKYALSNYLIIRYQTDKFCTDKQFIGHVGDELAQKVFDWCINFNEYNIENDGSINTIFSKLEITKHKLLDFKVYASITTLRQLDFTSINGVNLDEIANENILCSAVEVFDGLHGISLNTLYLIDENLPEQFNCSKNTTDTTFADYLEIAAFGGKETRPARKTEIETT